MKYMLMIHQGTTPTPLDPEAWATLSADEQQAVYADYQAVNATPGVTPGNGLQPPDTATTVRVEAGKTIIVVSHGLGQLEGLCDEIAWLERGTSARAALPRATRSLTERCGITGSVDDAAVLEIARFCREEEVEAIVLGVAAFFFG